MIDNFQPLHISSKRLILHAFRVLRRVDPVIRENPDRHVERCWNLRAGIPPVPPAAIDFQEELHCFQLSGCEPVAYFLRAI